MYPPFYSHIFHNAILRAKVFWGQCVSCDVITQIGHYIKLASEPGALSGGLPMKWRGDIICDFIPQLVDYKQENCCCCPLTVEICLYTELSSIRNVDIHLSCVTLYILGRTDFDSPNVVM